MAAEKHVLTTTFTAGADLSAIGNLYKFVKIASAGTVTVCDGATDIPIGVLQSLAPSGKAVAVCMLGISKIQADADLAIGNLVGTSADGQADAKTVASDSTEYAVGVCLENTGAAGDYTMCSLNCVNPHRAA